MEKRQVIVVGAGPAGSTAAFYLAKEGIDVLLVDKERWPRDKVCGDCQSPYCWQIYKEMGILEEAREHADTILTGQQFSGVDEQITTYDMKRPISFITRRYVIDDIVRRAAVEKAGVDFREAFEVVDLIMERGYVRGVKAIYNNEEIEVKADAVILANGSHSKQAMKLGFITDDPDMVFIGARAYFRGVKGLPRTVFEEHYPADIFFPSGYIWLFAEGDDIANVGVYITEKNLRDGNRKLEDYFWWWRDNTKIGKERLGEAELIGDIKGWRLPTCKAVGEYCVNGAIGVGDCGNFIQAHSGEGFAPAMNTGKVAALVLAEALKKGDVSKEALSVLKERLEEHEMMPGMKMKNYYKMMWEVRNHICSDPETFAEFLEYSRNQPGYPIIGATNVYTKYLREEKGIALDIDDNLSTGGH